jgi:5-methylcytosine-specific restriction endonuclease McrA
MKHLACITCGKEKITRQQQMSMYCISCSLKGKPRSNETKEKISESLKDKPHSIERRRNTSLALGGNGDVKGRHKRGHARWAQLVIKRDGKCMTCNSTERLEAHHILAKAMYPQFATIITNGITLCKPCHRIGPNAIHRKNHNDQTKKETNTP